MAFSRMVEGNRIVTCADGNFVDMDDHNEIQDQIIEVVEARYWQIGPYGAYSEHDYVFIDTNDPPRWDDSTIDGGGVLLVPLPFLLQGMVITEITLTIGSTVSAGATDQGEISLMRCQVADAATEVQAVSLDATNPWVVGGAGPKKVSYTSAVAGIPYTVPADSYHWLRFDSHDSGVGGEDCYFYGGIVLCQFGT